MRQDLGTASVARLGCQSPFDFVGMIVEIRKRVIDLRQRQVWQDLGGDLLRCIAGPRIPHDHVHADPGAPDHGPRAAPALDYLYVRVLGKQLAGQQFLRELVRRALPGCCLSGHNPIKCL